MVRLAIFASGNGSNFQSLVENQKNYKVVLLICDNINAFVIERAKKLNIPFIVKDAKLYQKKADFESDLLNDLLLYNVDFIALAGYMRVIGHLLLEVFKNKIVNIHPSLLPAFKGKDAILQAIESGVKETGVSIHFVDCGIDTGKIIDQVSFTIKDGMTRVEIEEKVHLIEHRLYPEVLNKLLK